LWRKTHAGERAKARQEALREQRAKNKKEALKEQMKIEQEERERIQSVKEKEKVQTSKEIEKFKEASLVAAKERPQAAKQEEQKSKRVVAEEEEEALPAPRACKTLQVKFTPRVFPTPQRESTQRQENEVGVGLCAGLRRGPVRQRDEPGVAEEQGQRLLLAGQLPGRAGRLLARPAPLPQGGLALLEPRRLPLQAAQPHQVRRGRDQGPRAAHAACRRQRQVTPQVSPRRSRRF